MDQDHLQRLHEEQINAIESTKSKIVQLEKFKSDYIDLRERLKTLPNEVTHNVMVPFGPLAFMPGKLVHTNEITVYLGDNWFVERSASQSCDIIDRRIIDLEKQIKGFTQQQGLLDPRLEFTTELAGDNLREIREEYDEETEKRWKAQHRKNVQQYRRRLNEGKSKMENFEVSETDSDEKLWARLEQLELEEDARNELELLDTLEDFSSSPRLKNDVSSDDSTGEDSNLNVIYFTHSKASPKKESESTSSGTITSPADVYKLINSEPKSILKSMSSNGKEKKNVRIVEAEDAGDRIRENIDGVIEKTLTKQQIKDRDMPLSAFTGVVREAPQEASRQNNNENLEAEFNEKMSDPPKRISRFKAARMHNR